MEREAMRNLNASNVDLVKSYDGMVSEKENQTHLIKATRDKILEIEAKIRETHEL
jgi:uncharacterized protein involved in tolerance to divalent cations